MKKLVLKRKKLSPIAEDQRAIVRIRNESYNKLIEVAGETGMSLTSIVSKMVDFAYDNIVYEFDD